MATVIKVILYYANNGYFMLCPRGEVINTLKEQLTVGSITVFHN